MHIYLYICMYTYIYVYIYIYVYACILPGRQKGRDRRMRSLFGGSFKLLEQLLFHATQIAHEPRCVCACMCV